MGASQKKPARQPRPRAKSRARTTASKSTGDDSGGDDGGDGDGGGGSSDDDPYAGLPTGELAEPHPPRGHRRQEETGSPIGNHELAQFDDKADNSMLHAALRLVRRGFPAFPCIAGGKNAKHPSLKGWQQKATADPATIENWWSRNYQGHAIGMPTGDASGVFVVDVDTKNGARGLESLAALEEEHGKLPATFRVRTPSGGFHIYFKMPPGIEIGNSGPRKGKPGKLGFGIDVRGTGGLVLAAPSILLGDDGEVCGNYESIDRSPVADPPPWLVKLLKEEPTAEELTGEAASGTWVEVEVRNQCATVEKAQGGARNTTLNDAAFALGQIVAMDTGLGAAEESLLAAARLCGLAQDDGERNVRATIKSGLNAGLKSPRPCPFFVDKSPKSGTVDQRSIRNVEAFLAWSGVKLRYDVFSDKPTLTGMSGHDHLSDNACKNLWFEAHRVHLRADKIFFRDCLEAIALKNEHHPVRDLFDDWQSQWDGVSRIGGKDGPGWLSTYLGAEDTPLVRAHSHRTMIAVVRRIRKPGTKYDDLLVLEGKQGTKKSTALKVLAIRPEWFTDCSSLSDDTKKFIEQTAGKLIVENGELKGIRRAETEHVKATLSRDSDRARMAYAHFVSEVKRQFVIIATTNESHYLTDPTGNRRFAPVKVGVIDLGCGRVIVEPGEEDSCAFIADTDKLAADLVQLWAEAAYREAQGESIEPPSELWEDAAVEQRARRGSDPWLEELGNVLGDLTGRALTGDVRRVISKSVERWSDNHDTRMGRVMRELGFEKKLLRTKAGRAKFYVKGEPPHHTILISVDQEGCATAVKSKFDKMIEEHESENKAVPIGKKGKRNGLPPGNAFDK